MASVILDEDVVPIRNPDGTRAPLATLFWGDELEVLGEQGDNRVVALPRRKWDAQAGHYVDTIVQGWLPKRVKLRTSRLLKIRFLDVGQGDATMLETPSGKFVLIDGGEEDDLRHYVNVAFAHLMKTAPLSIDAIVITHGDADHFAGLTKLAKAKRNGQGDPMISVERIYHNGLVKGPSNLPEAQMFGPTVSQGGKVFITGLRDDIRTVPASELNAPFKTWQTAASGLKNRAGGSPQMRRTTYGDAKAQDILAAHGKATHELGPIIETVNGQPALPFLHKPGTHSNSASHTINGHSVVLRFSYGNVRLLFGADLNEESENSLVTRARNDGKTLASEILKVPHHGSADFSPSMFEAVRPVVSVISSGDENPTKEYIHPRAGLVGALGKFSRESVERPLIYVTEMVAFFERIQVPDVVNAYRKRAFGIVHVRTDGERVMVATHSGKEDMKESYAFRVAADGGITFES
jgi:beta-lactamase superfamily II metal-dependent hydrolase